MAFFVSRMHSIETVTPVHNLQHHQPSLRYTELFIVRYNSKIKPNLRKRMRLHSQVFRFRFRQPTVRGVTKAQPKAAVFRTFLFVSFTFNCFSVCSKIVTANRVNRTSLKQSMFSIIEYTLL